MIAAGEIANWEVLPNDDPRIVSTAQRLVAAAAAVAEQRNIVVVRIDNWFGRRWLGFPKRQYRIRLESWRHVQTIKKFREPIWLVPPFHPHRVLSEKRFELREDGAIWGPFPQVRQLHQLYIDETNRVRSFERTLEPGIYAWFSGHTKLNDRAALMVYTHAGEGTSGWYVEFRRAESWQLSRRTLLGDADWRRLLTIDNLFELMHDEQT